MSKKGHNIYTTAFDKKGRVVCTGQNEYTKSHPWQKHLSIKAGMSEERVFYPSEVKALLTAKNSKEAIDACYYNKGKHPRSWMSRYIWLGLRNRGKKSYMKPVKDDSLEQEEMVWGTDNLTRGDRDNLPVTGWTVVKLGSYWQMIGCLDTGFKGYFQEPKWGWKTGLSQSLFERYGSGMVMSVGHNLKLRKRAD